MAYVYEQRRKEGKPTREKLVPLTADAFCKVWRNQCDIIRIMSPGSDQCDKCIQVGKIFTTNIDEDINITL